MNRALIVGCGYTGAALSAQLADADVEVFTTSTQNAEDPRHRQLDLTRDVELSLPESEGAVVYYMVSTLFRQYDPDARPHLQPLRRLLRGLVRPRGVVYLSSTSVYGDRRGGWVDEESTVAPSSPWALMRVELEAEVRAYGAEQGIPACIARLPEIYGPGRGPQSRLRQGLSRSEPVSADGRGYVLRYPERYSNRIHIDDLAAVLRRLGERLDQPLLLVSDDRPARSEEVYRFTARQLGIDLVVAPPEQTADLNLQALRSESKRCQNARLRAWHGALRYPSYVEGITAILSSEGSPQG